MTKKFQLSLALTLVGLVLLSCAQTPAPGADIKSPPAKVAAPATRTDWQQRWEAVRTEAKKEGRVSVYALWSPQIRTAVTQAFKEKYGIDLEFSAFSRGAEMSARVQAERRAGLYIADVFGAGTPTLLTIMKPDGFLDRIEPLLVLPEVLDPKAWLRGKLPLEDRDGLVLAMTGFVIQTLLRNTNLVKEGEIASHKDLLKPQYRGKITLGDPTVTGAGQGVIAHLGDNLWGEAETREFLRRLVKEQEAVVQRDNRALVESVARGKYAIAWAPSAPIAIEFINLGAPVAFAPVKENDRITASTGGLGVSTKLTHPNAAMLFVNWLLTREGQSVFAKAIGYPSTRLDASTEGVNPIFIPKPGEKYYSETEEFVLGPLERWLGLSKKIIDEAMK